MLSFIIPARSLQDVTKDCLTSVFTAAVQLGIISSCEFVLLDDDSDQREGITELFRHFRENSGVRVRSYRFTKRQHYTGAFAFGLSRAEGDLAFFISNDMIVTPAWLRTLIAVSALDRSIGIVRGTANIVDSHDYHQVALPFPERSYDDFNTFAEYVSKARGLEHSDDVVFSGDAVLLRRELIQKIGVLDTRFYGYLGDPDYGLRARRAGFRLVCAKGAWLNHFGQGHVKAEHFATGADMNELHNRRMKLVNAAFEQFKAKWGSPPVPAQPCDVNTWPWDRLVSAKHPATHDYFAPIPDDGAIAVAI